MLSKIKNYLQTKWIDRYTPEPVYIRVREAAVESLEESIVGLMSDPGTQYAILDKDRLAVLESLSSISGKPRGWYLIFIHEELKRRRRHDAAVKEVISGY